MAFINVLRSLGVGYVVAEEEADSQLGYLYREGHIYAVVSSDADMYAHGIKRLFYKFSLTTFIWSYIDLELIKVQKHAHQVDDWRKQLYLAMDVDENMALVLWCALVGNDYNPGGIRGIGVKHAAEVLHKVIGVARGDGTFWDKVEQLADAAAKEAIRHIKDKDTVAVSKQIRTGMTWFFCQKVYDISPNGRETLRQHELPPWVMRGQEDQGQGRSHTPEERSLGLHLDIDTQSLVPVKQLQYASPMCCAGLPRDDEGRINPVLHIGALATEIPGMVLPVAPEKATKDELVMYLKSWTGATTTGNRAELVQHAIRFLELEENHPNLAAKSREDPSGQSALWYIHQLNNGWGAAPPSQLDGVPDEASFQFTNLYSIAAHTPVNFDAAVLQRWKDRVAPEDGGREMSANVLERVRTKVAEVPLSLSTLELKLSEARLQTDKRLWYKALIGASMRKGTRYLVYCSLEVDADDDGTLHVKNMEVHCTACPAAQRDACSHAGTLAEIIYSIRRRAAIHHDMLELICTSEENAWHRGRDALDHDEIDVTVPLHCQEYGGDDSERARGGKRVTFLEHQFDPRSQLGRNTTRSDAVVAEKRVKLMELVRRDEWAVRDSWDGHVVTSGEDVIAARHAKGLMCRLAVDLYEGRSDDEEYDYCTAEGWPSIQNRQS